MPGPQPKRCDFFLWADQTKTREELAVLNNSRSEPESTLRPKTPERSVDGPQFPTPTSNARDTKIRTRDMDIREKKEDFGWSLNADEEIAIIAQNPAVKTFMETPRKAARTSLLDSPSKRDQSNKTSESYSNTIRPAKDDVFTPQSSKNKLNSSGLMSPERTPIRGSSNPVGMPIGQLDSESSLASEILALVKPANLSQQLESQVSDLLHRHELRTQGIIKGRDITRLAVQSKEKKIAELQARITELEAEREISRTVISHLKQDMAKSLVKSKGRNKPESENPDE